VVPYTRYILKNVKVYKVPEYLIIPLHDGRANFFFVNLQFRATWNKKNDCLNQGLIH
jgi:hypothetical protein